MTLIERLQLIAKQRFVKGVTKVILAITILLIGSWFAIFLYLQKLELPVLTVPQSTIYYATDGTVIGETNDGEKRYWVELDQISPYLIDATIAIEDRRFFRHPGIDFKRIGGAIVADIKARAKVQGASTITQQYARNLFLQYEKSWRRKLTELFYALRLEMNYTKREILEGYLNTINYGHGAYGIEAASQFYFNKSAQDLNLSEATMLAGIPKGPAVFSPLVAKEKARERQLLIIKAMADNNFIDNFQAQDAAETQLAFHGQHQFKRNEIAPYFQDAVINNLKNVLRFQPQVIAQGGLRIYTTLDLDHQKKAEDKINSSLKDHHELEVGLMTINNETGEVTALVGGKDYERSPFNRAIQAARQPGSTIKPLLYYAALESGFTPTTTLRSEPTNFQFENNRKSYQPANFNNQYANDEITLTTALALSDNVFAVKTHLYIGTEQLIKTAQTLGITTALANVPSLALGTSDVRLDEMATAFSILANGGNKIEPVFIRKIENYRGETIYEHQWNEEQVLDPKLAFVTTQMMTGMFDQKLNSYAQVTGQTIANKLSRPYGGKSGTTATDSWMIGFSPQLTTAVWTGYDQGKRLTNHNETTFAKEIWIDFMESAHKNLPVKGFQAPAGVVSAYIDHESGQLATEECPNSRLTYFVAGTEPSNYCQIHRKDDQYKKQKPPVERDKHERWYKKIWQFFN